MFTEIVSNIETDTGMDKIILLALAKAYEDNLPSSLSMNQYDLSKEFGFSPQQWKDFMKIREVDRLIESEIASIAEIGARKAIERLQSSDVNSSDISASKEILNNSKLIKQKTNQRPLIFITRIPEKERS